MRRRDQIRLTRRVDAVKTGRDRRRTADAHVDFLRACRAHHPHDFAAGRTPDDRIVDQDDALAVQNAPHRIQLDLHAEVPNRRLRLDERPSDIVIADQSHPKRHARLLRVPHRGADAGVGHRNDDVAADRLFARQHAPEIRAYFVHAASEYVAVGPREVDVLENAARTSNAHEMTADGVIGKQWARMMQDGVYAKIPNKADQSIVAVYSDYASDHNGEYTYLLGARVTSDGDVPAGMVAKKIPGGRFAVFTSEKGPAPTVVPETGMKINSLPQSATGGDRAYQADYEVYDERARDPQNLQVDVYVGIR